MPDFIHYWTPHPAQHIISMSTARFKAVACGRRFGKTVGAWEEMLKFGTKPRKVDEQSKVLWWVAPVYKELAPVSEIVKQEKHLPQCIISKTLKEKETFRYILLDNGNQIWFHSADDPDALRGSGVDYLVIDEAAQVKRNAWESVLRPALADRKGCAMFISTPKGHNWFFDVWTRGKDPLFPDYHSFTFPTSSNPYIDAAEIEDARMTLPEAVFNQEYLALFMDNVGSIFRKIDSHIREGMKFEGPFMKGYDLAKHQDFTVLIALDKHGNLAGFERFQKLDWVYQKKKIRLFDEKFVGPALMDSTGIGDPIFDDLDRVLLDLDGYKFTSGSKKDLVENLSVLLDKDDIHYPNNEVLLNELKIFTYTVGATGNIRYGAPEGYHDDCVIGLGLAAWLLGSYRVPTPLIG